MKCAPQRYTVALAATPVALLCALFGGCGSSGVATPAAGQRTIEVPERPPAAASTGIPAKATSGSFAGVNFGAYERTLADVLYRLNSYWNAEVTERHRRYAPAPIVIAWDREGARPECGSTRAPPEDAEFCGRQNTIVFDEPGFVLPFYREIGPVAAATVLAHEWGHLVQDRLGVIERFDEVVQKELNADCLAGVWAQAMIQAGAIARDELREATNELYATGDAPSVRWQSPDAHGTGDQRVRSFDLGRRRGLTACLAQRREPSLGRPGGPP